MRLPEGLRRPLLGRFAAALGANLDEAEKDLGAYVSFLDFFTRRLKPGARPQAPVVPGGINSPVDGLVIAEGRVKEGTLLQAKGLPYRLDELLDGDPLAPEFARARYSDALPRAEGLSPHPRSSDGRGPGGRARGRRALARERRVHGLDAAPLREEPPRLLDRARRARGRGPHRGRRHGRRDARGRRRRGPALALGPRPAAPGPARGGESPVRER